MQLESFVAFASTFLHTNHVFQTRLGGRKGNQQAHIRIEASRAVFHFPSEHADDAVEAGTVFDFLSERTARAEHFSCRLGSDHGDVREAVQIRPAEESAFLQFQSMDFLKGGGRADHLDLDRSPSCPDVLFDFVRGCDCGDSGHERFEPHQVELSESIREYFAAPGQVLRPATVDQYAIRPESQLLLAHLVAGALADGQQGDDRSDPKDDPQNRQQRSQLVQEQALNGRHENAHVEGQHFYPSPSAGSSNGTSSGLSTTCTPTVSPFLTATNLSFDLPS